MYIKFFIISLFTCCLQINLSAQFNGIIIAIGAAKVNNAGPLNFSERAPQFSIRYRKYRENNHFHQFSLNNFWTKKFSTANFDVEEFQIGLQYAYGVRLGSVNNVATFYVGGSGGVEYADSDATPLPTVANFRRTQSSWSLLVGGFAKLQFLIRERLIFEFHFPIGVFQAGVDNHRVHDPGRPERQQTNGGFNFDVKYKVGVEFGLGWRF